jgi:hypothetical protein
MSSNIKKHLLDEGGGLQNTDQIVKKLGDFDRTMTREMTKIEKVLLSYKKQMNSSSDGTLYKKMVEKNLMKLDSDIDVFVQDAEEWMDKIKGGGK